MTLRNRYLLVVGAAAIILLTGSTATLVGIGHLQGLIEQSFLSENLVHELDLLRGLALEYQINPSPRAADQWREKYAQVRRDLAAQPGIPTEVREAFANMGVLFTRIAAPPPDTATRREGGSLQERLHTQQLLSLQSEGRRIIDWLQDFLDDARERLLAGARAFFAGAVLLLATLTLLIVLLLSTSGRRIVRSLSLLESGAQAVARGDLDHRIDLPGRDEFSSLAASFNSMSGHLARQATIEARFFQAQKLEAVGTMAGGIAHDFNNLLNGIIGFTELSLMKLPPDSEVRGELKEVLKVADRAADLVRQILTFSRMSDKGERPVAVKPIVAEVMKLLRASIPTTVDFRLNLASDSTVLADPTEIHRIVVNLCVNASQAMRESGGTLEVALEEVSLDPAFAGSHPGIRPGRFLRLRVRDSGHGMTPEVKARIFDPFFTTKGEEGGTGMGLPVVHGIARNRGGAILVESAPGEGTVFDVFLPLAARAAGEEEVPAGTPSPGTERVLVVDDEPMVTNLLEEGLGILGYRVSSYASAAQALEAFERDPGRFDLVISDVTMPGMTGDALLTRVRLLRPGVPFILCTGFSDRLSPEKARALGANAFLMKPLALGDLSRVIRQVLDKG